MIQHRVIITFNNNNINHNNNNNNNNNSNNDNTHNNNSTTQPKIFKKRVKSPTPNLPTLPEGYGDCMGEGDNATGIPFWIWCKIIEQLAHDDASIAVKSAQVSRMFFRAARHNTVWKTTCAGSIGQTFGHKNDSEQEILKMYGSWLRFYKAIATAACRQTVLVVDDNPMNCKVAKALLTRRGFTIDIAMNGELALAYIKANYNRILVVLMGVHKPVMVGQTFAKLVREYEEKNDLDSLPMIAWSADDSTTNRAKCLENFNYFIAKPFSPRKFMENLQELVPAWISDRPTLADGPNFQQYLMQDLQ